MIKSVIPVLRVAAALTWDNVVAPADKPYGMRELVVIDPDGNRLCFGQDLA